MGTTFCKGCPAICNEANLMVRYILYTIVQSQIRIHISVSKTLNQIEVNN